MGMDFNLTCSAIGLPDPTIELFKDGRPVILPDEVLKATRISDGVYQFRDADASFTDGQYFCRANNTYGQSDSHTATVTVQCK